MATTKKDLINRIAEKTGSKQTAVKAVIQHFFDEVIAELAMGNRLEFRDFGVFETKTSASRTAQNPKTLERVRVPAKRRVVFKAGRLMREEVNGTPPQHSTRSISDMQARCNDSKKELGK
jgi:integration host factor subunit beta